MASYALLKVLIVAVLIIISKAGFSILQPKVIKSLKAQGLFTVILALQGPHSDESMSWIFRVRLPVQVWTHFGEKELDQLMRHTESNTKVVVLVPVSTDHQRTVIVEKLKHHIIYLSLVRLLFVLKRDDVIAYKTYPDVACALILLNSTTADVPKTDFWNCTERAVVDADKLFSKNRRRAWTALKQKTFVATTLLESASGAIIESAYTHPIGQTLMRCLRHLNVSILHYFSTALGPAYDQFIDDVLKKRSDVSLIPNVVTLERSLYVHVDTFASEAGIGFYSADGRDIPSILSTGRSLRYILPLALVCACLIAAICYLASRWLAQSPYTSCLALFLFASFTGKSFPLHPRASRYSVDRLMCASWLAGMFFLVIYVQSEITSIASVPTLERAIETAEDVERHARAGQVQPCVIEHRYTHRKLSNSTSGTLGTLSNLLAGCGQSCLSGADGKACIKGARHGTHVFLVVTRDGARDPYRAAGIATGKDQLHTFFCGLFVSKAFPYISEHRSLLRAIFEAGLYEAMIAELERKNRMPVVKDQEVEVRSPLVGYMLLYGTGCAAGCLALLVERCFEALGQKHVFITNQ